MSSSFERHLYQQANSRSEYLNRSTLSRRVQILATNFKKKVKRSIQHKTKNKGIINCGATLLRGKLGVHRYTEVLNLVKSILDIRRVGYLNFLNSTQTGGCCFASKGRIPRSCSPRGSPPPRELLDIYFCVRLVDKISVLGSSSSVCSEGGKTFANNVDWDDLIIDAKNKLNTFREWEKTNQTKQV